MAAMAAATEATAWAEAQAAAIATVVPEDEFDDHMDDHDAIIPHTVEVHLNHWGPILIGPEIWGSGTYF